MMDSKDQKPIGHYEGSRFTGRYWVGGCTCGSGKEGHEVYDHHGIYFGISCSECKKGPRERQWDEDTGRYEDWEEPIDE